MANTKVTYTGDGTTTNFNVPFPYIQKSDVFVYVNQVLQIHPLQIVWLNASTIQFFHAPKVDDAVEIKRFTPMDTPLVNFQNSAVLTAADLNLSQQQNFYVMQEAVEGFYELVNNALLRVASGTGIVETETDEVLAALVNEMLQEASAATLQQRVSDIDTNAESIVQLGTDLQVQVNTLAQGTAAIVYIQDSEPVPGVGGIPDPITDGARWYDSDDNNKPYIYDGTATQWMSLEDPRIGQAVADISVLQTDVAGNAAAIVNEQTARSTADSAFASELALLGAQNGAQTAFILDSSTVKIDSDVGDTVATRLSQLDATDSNNAAAIASEESARVSGDSANASSISALDVRMTDAESDIVTNAASIVTEQNARVSGDSANASDITALQARVTTTEGDIATNAADIITEQNARASGDSANASSITALSARVTTAEGDISTNAADIVTEQNARASGDSAIASDVTSLTTTVDGHTTTINTHASSINGLEGKYGVTIESGTYVSGFVLNSGGGSSSFKILADNFAIVQPGTYANKIWWDGANSRLQIAGDLIVQGTINGADALSTSSGHRLGSTQIADDAISSDHIAANQILAGHIKADEIEASHINITNLATIANAETGNLTVNGSLTMNSSGHMKGGQTAYNTGSGFFLGYSGAAYKFSVGSSTGNRLTWDGTTLTVVGEVKVGEYIKDTAETIAEANTARSVTGMSNTTYTEKKKFTIDRDGDVNLYFDYYFQQCSYANGAIRWKKNGVTIASINGSTPTSWTSSGAKAINGLVEGDVITVELAPGQWYSDAPESGTTHIRNCQLRATVTIPGNATVNTN